MDAPGFASPIRTYRQNLNNMRESNDPNGSEVTNLCSLGVVDLDLSLCPDVFGLKAFDENMPITRMLPGSSPCELRLLLPDTNIGNDGFHDVVVENLIGSSTWRSRHVSPSDVITLRRRWPRAVFQVMKERSTELEDLRRQAYTGLQWAYRCAHPGYCPSGLLPGVQHSGGLPGFYCGASGFSGDWKIQTDRTRPDSISAPAPTTPTDERRDQMRKAGAGRRFPLQKHFVGPSNGCYPDIDGIYRK